MSEVTLLNSFVEHAKTLDEPLKPYTIEEIDMMLDEAENDFETGNYIPNEETIAAINEAKSDKNHSKVYSNAEEMINDILNEEE